MVDNGAVTPKPCLSPAEMRTRTATGCLLPVGTSSTAMRTIFPRPLGSWSLGETKKHTSRIKYQLVPFWRKTIQTKSKQTLVFDPGGSKGRLRVCPFFGNVARVVLWGSFLFGACWYPRLERVWQMHDAEHHLSKESTSDSYVLGLIAVSSPKSADTWSSKPDNTRLWELRR